jgi:putative heme-binding domain-containing protein
VVQRQLATPRFELAVLSAQVTGDRRTLVLSTAPQTEAVSYAVTLPRPTTGTSAGVLPQDPTIELGYGLTGITAAWQARDGGESWTGWLPHLNLDVARTFTAHSADHDRFWPMIRRPGRLTLRTQLDLWHMLRPAVQQGSVLDYTLPAEQVTLNFVAAGPVHVTTTAGTPEALPPGKDGRHQVRLKVHPHEGQPIPVEIVLDTGKRVALDVTYSTNEDPRPRALPLHRLLLPWAVTAHAAEPVAERAVPELRGGSWTRGRTLFFSEQAQCARCHQVRGQGGKIGPDLSNLIHRDYESVLRDIRQPSAAINPDFLTYMVELKDGRFLQGTVRTEGNGRVAVGDTAGKETVVKQANIEAMTPAAVSTMPEGLDRLLGADGLRDLLTFLLTEPLAPAPLENEGAPPPRRRAEVEAVLRGSKPAPTKPRKLTVVLSAGPARDHGPGEHDYPLWQRRWAKLLRVADGVTVRTVTGWPGPKDFEQADVIALYSHNPGWSAAHGPQLDAFLKRGGGLVVIHWAVSGLADVKAYSDRIGLAAKDAGTRFRHGPLELDFTGTRHPIARNLGKLRLIDESYWDLVGDPGRVRVLTSAREEGRLRPQVWVREQGKGRVFVSIPGHYTWTFDDPLFRVLLLRGIAWSAHEPVDRFNELATVGARVRE